MERCEGGEQTCSRKRRTIGLGYIGRQVGLSALHILPYIYIYIAMLRNSCRPCASYCVGVGFGPEAMTCRVLVRRQVWSACKQVEPLGVHICI